MKKSCLALAVAHALGLPMAQATTFNVNQNSACTLPDAVAAANTDSSFGSCPAGAPGIDTINITGDIILSQSAVGVPFQATPPVASPITIVGNGHAISRAALAPSFRFASVTGTGNLTLSDITISNMSMPSGYSAGGLYVTSQGTLTVENSTLSSNTTGLDGGAIYSNGSVNLYDSTLTLNSAISTIQSRSGGAIFSRGTLYIHRSLISNNNANENGGGLRVFGGIAKIYDSTFENNIAVNSNVVDTASYGAGGGGIYSSGRSSPNFATAQVEIHDSTIRNNTAVREGGGINSDFQSYLTVTGSTITGNQAIVGGGIRKRKIGNLDLSDSSVSGNVASVNGDYGGGMAIFGGNTTISRTGITDNGNNGVHASTANVYIENSTISGNSGVGLKAENVAYVKVTNSTISSNAGEGLYALDQFGQPPYSVIEIANSIVSGNSGTAFSANAELLAGLGYITSGGNNIFGHSGKTTDETWVDSVRLTFDPSDIIATSDGNDPTALLEILEPLANIGGSSLTHALPENSPAINAGNQVLCATDGIITDQRGIARDEICDIGAFEFIPPEPETCFVMVTVDDKVLTFCM